MRKKTSNERREVTAIKVHQWLDEWEKVGFDDKFHRRRPDNHFYLFTLSASELKNLSGIYRRITKGGLLRSEDLGIQRRHEKDRSDKIGQFVQYGYPWSDLNQVRRESGKYDDLRKPGWLPTAIVVNILKAGDKRQVNNMVDEKDLVNVTDVDRKTAAISLPKGFGGVDWRPSNLPPIEIIDGQHRLWAFSDDSIGNDYELPIVAFHGLDISWQAYLFWSINVTPKRINPSLAFDLYPLLRTEDWLDRFEGHSVYRETRAQEITEGLWSNSKSPWYQRINMLGEKGLNEPMVSQAAWIRSLLATYIKAWEPRGKAIGGLFGAEIGEDREALPWSRPQQIAFLILMGEKIREAISNCKEKWAETIRSITQKDLFKMDDDNAFTGQYTLLNTDQGIRGLLSVTNDLCYIRSTQLNLHGWTIKQNTGAVEESEVNQALSSLRKQPVFGFLNDIASCLAKYDWRTSSAPDLEESERIQKSAFRGSGGYKELRLHLLSHLAKETNDIGKAASEVLSSKLP